MFHFVLNSHFECGNFIRKHFLMSTVFIFVLQFVSFCSMNSLSSIDEYVPESKRFCANGVLYDETESLRNQPTEERINTCFGYLQDAPLNTLPDYIPDLCNDLAKHGRKDGLQHLLQLVKDSPIAGRDAIYNHMFTALRRQENSYSHALKQLVSIIYSLGKPTEVCIDYIARKIICEDNDNIGAFLNDLKEICSNGYKFKITMVNRLMQHCIDNFNIDFHQFVLTRIVNKLSKSELDVVNSTTLNSFVARRMANVKQHRMGLSRKI